MATDVDREIGRFEEFLESEFGIVVEEVKSLDDLENLLKEWMDSIDIPDVYQKKLKDTLINGLDESGFLSEEVGTEIEKFKKRRWTEEEIKQLRELYHKGVPINVIIKELRRSKSSIYHKASRTRIRRPKLSRAAMRRLKRRKLGEVV